MQSAVYTKTEKSTIGEDTPLVLLNLCLPQVRTEDKSPFTKAFGAYYKALSPGFMQFCEGDLKREAKNAASGEGFKPYGAVLTTVIAMENQSLVSLYVDASIAMGDRKRTHRLSQLWHKDTGTLIKANRLFEKGAVKKLLPLLRDCAEEYMAKTGTPLYSDWESLIKKRFERERFYLSPKGASFYYQAGELNAGPKPVPLHLPVDGLLPLLKPEMAGLILQET